MNIETSIEHKEKEHCYSVSAARLDEEWYNNIINLSLDTAKKNKITLKYMENPAQKSNSTNSSQLVIKSSFYLFNGLP